MTGTVNIQDKMPYSENSEGSLLRLDDNGCYFQKQNGNHLWEIIKQDGSEIYFDMCLNASSIPFVWYAKDRILASKDNKFGFLSIHGSITIPFKYDEIEPREDGMFDVRVGDAWGVINLDGLEVIRIKYSEKIPIDYDRIIVEDAFVNVLRTCGGTKGILNKNGIEFVPCIYDELFFSDKNIIIYGYGVGVDEYYDTNVGYFKFHVKYGCINSQGIEIIPSIYDCFIFQDGFILGGRDGCSVSRCVYGGSNVCRIADMHDFYGTFDLYDMSGKMLIGGFNSFEYDKINSIFFFELGGNWEFEVGGEDGNDIYHHPSYSYIDSECRWLILNKEFSSILCLSNGERMNLEGFNIKTHSNNDDTKEWNIPMDLLSKTNQKPEVELNWLVYSDFFSKYAVRIKDGAKTHHYSDIKVVNDDTMFVNYSSPKGDQRLFGISKFITHKISKYFCEKLIFDCEKEKIYLMTFPIHGFFFCAKKIDDKNSCVLLYNLNELDAPPVKAISSIETSILSSEIAYGKLKIEIIDKSIFTSPPVLMKDGSDIEESRKEQLKDEHIYCLSDIRLLYRDIYDAEFVNQTDKTKTDNSLTHWRKYTEEADTPYWFTDNNVRIERIDFSHREYNDRVFKDEIGSVFDNPYYNNALDWDQQSPEFWDSL